MVTAASLGSRSSKISTPCSREPGGTPTWISSALSSSSGAASTSRSRASPGAATRSTRATNGSVGPCTRVKTITMTKTSLKIVFAPGTAAAQGMVASTMGTAPRSPAQERNACSRQVRVPIRQTLASAAETTTEAGRATRISAKPATSPGSIADGSSDGRANMPSITKSPIWASQAAPSANPRVAARCGSRAFPSTSPAR